MNGLKLKVGFAQNNPRILKVKENVEDCLDLIGRRKADLWVFPELFATGYRFKNGREVRQVAEKIPEGFTCRRLLDFSKKRNCAVVAGLVEWRHGSAFNSSILIHRGKVSIYRKSHLFGIEKKFFKAGDTGFSTRKISGVSVGMMICFDWFFPESARVLSLKGAELIVHPSNLVLPWGPVGMRMRSIENRVFTVTANRVGLERGLRFIGRSQVVAPDGKILVQAGSNRCQAETVEINPAFAKDKKVTRQNNIFKDRKVKHYSFLSKQ